MTIDEDSQIVLIVCLIVVLVNCLFIFSIFIYMCCCTVHVVNLHTKRSQRCICIKTSNSKENKILSSSNNLNHLDNIILQVADSDSDSH